MARTLKTNKENVVMYSVMGRIHHPIIRTPYKTTVEGNAITVPGVGGVTYNVKIGDSVYGMEADHVEPGVSISNSDTTENTALNIFSCIGNKAIVKTGDAKDAVGFVTGTHGGIEHVLNYFHKDDLEKMAPEDKILIKAQGQGLKLVDFPEIKVMNIDPELFEKLPMRVEDDKLVFDVVAKCPAYLMGSGIGSASAVSGDYDIMTGDKAELARLGLDKLRYGDFVMLENCDTTYGRGFLNGAVTIGVVIHSDCAVSGHGPGVTTVLASKEQIIVGNIVEKSNLADIMGV